MCQVEQSGVSLRRTRAHTAEGEKRRVLVVDDNVDAADSIAMILRMEGYEVLCVYDGPSVLEAAREYQPNAVVLEGLGIA